MVFDYTKFFMGSKFAIFNYATKDLGGYVDIDYFEYDCLNARDGVGDYEKAEFFETFDAKKLSEMMERFCR